VARAGETAVAAAPAAVVQKDPIADVVVARQAPAGSVIRKNPGAKPPAEPVAEGKAAPEQEPVLTTDHKVGRGQTLTQIASMYHTSVDDLKAMNGITDAASVQAGQTIKVRASGSEIVSTAPVGRTYKVKSGDTLWTVARANDTSVETLKSLNPKIGSAGIKAGQTIKVPSAGAVATASAADDEPTTKSTASAKPGARSASAKASGKSSVKVAKASPKASFRSHKVQKGQTLSSIAQRYSTSVDTLKRINGIRDASNVQVGKTLKVPL
jgi:membrane-bound lytic murein transglycosylase D